MGRERDVWSRSRHAAVVRVLASVCLLLCAALVAAGCGDSAETAGAAGPVELGFMTSRDATGFDAKLFRRCEREGGGEYRIRPIFIGPTVDAMREQITRRMAAGDESIDLINLDVIWTAEFSDAGWLVDLTERIEPIKDEFVAPAVQSTFYKGKYWAISSGTNGPVLYYRSDLVKQAPKTWEELEREARRVQQANPGMAGFVFQGAPYEGGTVDALEFMSAAGTKVLSEDGSKALIGEGDGVEHAFGWLRSIMESKVAPKVVTTYMEEDARLAFQKGDAVFMRNWPYAWALMNQDDVSKVRGKFDVAPMPAFEGRQSAGVLGGQNFGIASTSRDPELAWKALTCLAGEQAQRDRAVIKGEVPTRVALFSDPKLQEKIPFLDVLKEGIDTGVNRPTTPYYNDVTIVIYKAYNDALNGRITPKQAAERMQQGVQAAIDGEAAI